MLAVRLPAVMLYLFASLLPGTVAVAPFFGKVAERMAGIEVTAKPVGGLTPPRCYGTVWIGGMVAVPVYLR